MLIAEYSYERDIQVKQREAREEGIREGIREGKQEGMLLSARIFRIIKEGTVKTDAQVAKEAGCMLEDVENTQKMFGI